MLKENFVETIAGSLKSHWDVECYSDLDGGTLTYGEVGNLIHRLHAVFEAVGIEQGDRIGLVGRNAANWCVAYLAVTTYGAVVVPILPDFTSGEMEHIVRHSGSRVLFLAEGVGDLLEESKMKDLEAILSLRDFTVAWTRDPRLAGKITAAEAAVTKVNAKDLAFPAVNDTELASIVYTSGTTGFSKGVMLNGKSLMSNIRFFNDSVELTPGDRMVSFLPLAHAFGCAFDFLAPTVAGCHIIYVEKIPTPKVLVAAFQEYRPVVVMSVPLVIEKIYRNRIKPLLETPKMQLLLKVPGLNKLVYKKIHDQIYEVFGGNFKEMVIGGAAINRDIETFFRRIGLRMTCGYGMTECGPLISYSVYDDQPPVGSVGRVIPYLECRIADADPTSGIGEVQVRGENRMIGYYMDDEATAASIDVEGWLHTGDLGRLDADGFLYLTGRSKNMILTSSGQNVYPEEIESQLNNMPCVAECLVLERDGQLLALVYPDLESVDKACLKGRQVEDMMEENRKFLNLKLPGYCRISKLKVLYEEFDKTPTKKIKRRKYDAFS